MKIISKIVNMGFGTLFLFAVLYSIVELYHALDERFKYTFLTIIFIIAMSVFICYVLYRTEKVLTLNEKLCSRLLYILPVFLLAAQITFAILVDFTPKNDLSYICKGAENYIKYGIENLHDGLPDRHQDYFYVYPNNHLLFLILVGIYKISYTFTGEISNALPTILNILALNLSYIFMILTAKQFYNPAKACICAIRGLMFTPLITYSTLFYTDSLAMPFVSAGIYLYVRCRKETNAKKSFLLLIVCSIISAFGYKMKGSVIILLIAIICDLFLHKDSVKSIMAKIITILTVFAVIVSILSAISLKVLCTSTEEMKKYEFPIIHWIMMSADGKGGYNYEDFSYTKSFEGYDEKIIADKERLTKKLHDQGVSGFSEHLLNKIGYTWHDGTYMTSYYNPDNEFLNGNVFLVIAEILHVSILFEIVQGYIGKRKDVNEAACGNFFLKICLAGLFIFLLIWEARCRYLISFMPLFALI